MRGKSGFECGVRNRRVRVIDCFLQLGAKFCVMYCRGGCERLGAYSSNLQVTQARKQVLCSMLETAFWFYNLKHWRGVTAICGLNGAPIGDLRLFVLREHNTKCNNF